MSISPDYSNIQPYKEDDVNDAILRMLANPVFQVMIDYLYPPEIQDKIRADLSKAKSSLEFQKIFMYTGLNSILEKTTPKGLHFENEKYVTDGRAVSYVSNHRDILLDSALLQIILVDLGLETTEISFGDNLNINDFVNDFAGVNRMFTVIRTGTPRELLKNAKNLSAYINHVLKNKERSIWIAHRKGRTKDGLDKTDLGVIKMLVSNSSKTVVEAIKDLEIVPLSISYEWEPCDSLKVRELYHEGLDGYQKEENEDINSLIGGIIEQKGGINHAFCKPVNDILHTLDEKQGNNPFLSQVVDFIDNQIIRNYKLWPSNYYAFDLANNTKEYVQNYTEETKSYFHKRMEKAVKLVGVDQEKVEQLFIDMYSNPVKSKRSLGL